MEEPNAWTGIYMPVLNNTFNKLFSIVVIFAIIAVSLVLVYTLNNRATEFAGWGKWLFISMYSYLIFIFFRTAIHLLLCFANLFFYKKPKKLSSYPLVSVIVPCYNEERVVKEAIKSVLSLTYPNLEIIAVDDGSKDRTIELLSEIEKTTKVRIISQTNGGKSMALNRGIEECMGEYFVCMDADSKLNPGAIELGISHIHGNNSISAVAGSVEIGNANTVITSFQRLEYITGLNLFKAAQSFLGMVTVVPGPIGIFRKSVVKKVGGYRTSTYAEDCELTMRMLVAGYSTIYIAGMVAVTEAPEGLKALIAQRYRWTRGIVQAIRENAVWLLRPFKNFRNFAIVLYMTIESVCIPIANFLFAILSLEYALLYNNSEIFGQYFLQMTLLDLILTLYCVITENKALRLIPYSVFSRITYGFGLEILRFLSVIDEVLGIPMTWNKLKRKGL